MKLADMKQKWSEMYPSKPAKDTDTFYPTLHFTEKQIAAMDVEPVRVGAEMKMTAIVRITTLSERDTGREMTFEIVECGVEPKEKKADASASLYPDDVVKG